MPTILITNFYAQAPLSVVRSLVPDGFTLLHRDRSDELIHEKIGDADYLVVGGRTKLDAAVIDTAPRLKMVQRSGVGIENIDLAALSARGIPLFVNQGVNARSVAEHTIMFILASLRRLFEVNVQMHQSGWTRYEWAMRSNDLYGKTVGLVGLGSVGKHVSRMLASFGVNVIYTDLVRLTQSQEAELDVRYAELSELLCAADIVSLHCPLTDTTRGIVGREQLDLMKDSGIIINTSRGGLIDQDALVDSINDGRIRGAALDVFEQEPLPDNSPLRSMPSVILSPHIAGVSLETFQSIIGGAFSNIMHYHRGELDKVTGSRVG